MTYDFDRIIDRKGTNAFKWQTRDRDLLPMWIADMDFEAPQEVVDAVVRRARHGVFGYSMPGEGFFKVVADWLQRRHNWAIQKEWITFCPGIVPGLNLLVQAFTLPGDKVIVQTPVYYPFYDAIQNNGRQIQRNPLILENGHYRMDFDDLAQKARDTRTKAIILCSPHNPVGRVWTREELTRLGNICLEHDVLVISDELHCDLVFKPHIHIPFAGISNSFAQNSVTCMAPSKTFNLAGLQTSTLIIPNETTRNRFLDTTFFKRFNPFGIVALEAAYTHGEPWLEQLMAYLAGNVRFLKEFFEAHLPRVKVIEPEGTYLVWADFRALGLSGPALEDLMLNKARLWLDEGYIFGKDGEGFERFNLACPRSVLADALERVKRAVRTI